MNNDEIILALKEIWEDEEDRPIKPERDLESRWEADRETERNE